MTPSHSLPVPLEAVKWAIVAECNSQRLNWQHCLDLVKAWADLLRAAQGAQENQLSIWK